jgi:hypothetical protein
LKGQYTKAVRNLRSIDQNALQHVIYREILKHLVNHGVRIRENGPLFKNIDAHEKIVKELCKSRLGVQVETFLGTVPKPTKYYNTDEAADYITKIVAWCAMDLNLQIEI